MEALDISGDLLDSQNINVSNGEIYLGREKNSGTKSIIDGILILFIRIASVLVYFACICQIFQKYCVSFRQDKYYFLMDRVEYVGHGLNTNGNCPVKSKFDIITD